MKNLCPLNDIVKRMRKVTDWEKILENHIFDKELVFIIYKEISNLIIRKLSKNPIVRWLKDI